MKEPALDPSIRMLDTLDEFRACAELQTATWGRDFVEQVPPLLMKVVRENGGLVGGALGPDGGLLGFVFGLVGLDGSSPYHWSHMLAVRSSARGHGLGRGLKLFQRRAVLGQGIKEIFWSYDPLVARNAHLNFNRLGVVADRYVPNMYGEETGSPLHQGLGTDRLVVRWQLDSERVRRTVTGKRHGTAVDTRSAPAAVLCREDGSGRPVAKDVGESRIVRIEIPCEIQSLKRDTPEVAKQWREATRQAFSELLGMGYGVDGLARTPEQRCYYVLSQECI